MIRLLAFDCDGTLVDTSSMIACLYEGYHRCFPLRDPLPYEHFIPCFAMTSNDIRKYLNIDSDFQLVFDKTCFGPESNFHKNSKAYSGMSDAILQLQEKGFEIAAVTSRSMDTWLEVREQLGDAAFSCFRFASTSDRIQNPKPAPDALYDLMEQSGFVASEILMIGDSMADALCAREAGVKFAWASWSNIPMELPPHTYHLRSVQDLLQLATVLQAHE